MTWREYSVVDVFTEVPLQGNPVAVFTDGSGLEGEVMQSVARELNLSETVFLLEPDADADARARIFTPTLELPFAGHPVLGTAFVLAQERAGEQIRLQTGAGVIAIALRREHGTTVYGEMQQPLPSIEPVANERALLRALGVERPALPVEAYRNGPLHVFVGLADAEEVANLEPDLGALGRLGAFGVSCFAVHDGRVSTRMFAPGLGVSEDPATGSAAGPLALHLARHGLIEFGERIEIHQGEQIERPSTLYATAEGSARETTRVVVGGGAVIVARGSYQLP
jgi:trans-2,3-dihydro-3-hydroxyanthranilate isomerase